MENRIELPLFDSGLNASEPITAGSLVMSPCAKAHAVELTREWHSRLPQTQDGPWMYAFSASAYGVTYAVALWNNPSARGLPNDWLELRRLACAPDSPKNTASRFLGYMARWFKTNHPEISRLISYQDTAVHTGTIYKAANWESGWITKGRERDRSPLRKGTTRSYRKNINGTAPDSSEKIRWEYDLDKRRGRSSKQQ